VITLEDWAEIRRLHRAELVPIKEIARRLGVARNTVRAALASGAPPKSERAAKGSIVDVVEPRIRALLREHPHDAGDGDRGADRLDPVDHGAQGPGSGDQAGVSGCGPGRQDRPRAR
jgi:hypothetical protein